jgi:hypothetical protein
MRFSDEEEEEGAVVEAEHVWEVVDLAGVVEWQDPLPQSVAHHR